MFVANCVICYHAEEGEVDDICDVMNSYQMYVKEKWGCVAILEISQAFVTHMSQNCCNR